MKKIKSISLLLCSILILASCSSDDSSPVNPEVDPIEGWHKIQDLSTDQFSVELYSQNQQRLQVGSNSIVARIKAISTTDNSEITFTNWKTTMHMGTMQHGAPVLNLRPFHNKPNLFEGNLMFQMASDGNENYWELEVQFEHRGQKVVVSKKVDVFPSKHQTIQSFKGSDNKNYVIALIAPNSPKIGINDMTTALFKMESMDSFTIVNQYKVQIDPRMPSMQNHSSPNNVHLTQSIGDLLYHGKLSLTMTGYWKINLQLLDNSGTLIKGETIDDTTLASSLFFELEF